MDVVRHGEPSPPHTPSRKDASVDHSPPTCPTKFEDVSWSEGKRKRIDTVADLHHSSLPESCRPPYYTRNSCPVDPTLSSSSSSAYSPPRAGPPLSTVAQVGHHHRPSLPHPHAPPHSAAHSRHQSSPVPNAHAQYHSPSMVYPSTAYPPPPQPPTTHPTPHHDPRSGYYPYPEARPSLHDHPLDRAPHDPYYQRTIYSTAPVHPPHPAYAQDPYQQPQYNYTFQSTLSVDQSSFNRKRRGNLPKEATGILKDWFSSHRESPYPTEDEKLQLCTRTGLTLNQVCWILNQARSAAAVNLFATLSFTLFHLSPSRGRLPLLLMAESTMGRKLYLDPL
jgi:hypothetical protein